MPCPPPARVIRPRETGRRAGMVALFNLVLWGLDMLVRAPARPDIFFVYTQAIGLSIWACIDLGRFLLRPDPLTGSLPLCKAAPLVAAGVITGTLAGTAVGDLYCGCNTWQLWFANPRRLAATVALTVCAAVVATYFFSTHARMQQQRERLAAAERDASLAKLTALQSQLEPHMLFNTLANLRVLIGLDPPRAQAMLDRLIAFLRATLTASRAPAHALAAEFERLDDYLQLMAVRMGPRLVARLELPDALRGVPVPPMLLQPLVENAVQHGLEPRVEGGRLTLRAERDGERLRLSVRDTGVGLHDLASHGTRFGLQQVRDRLFTLFGHEASLTLIPVADAEGGGTLAVIDLPFPPPTTP